MVAAVGAVQLSIQPASGSAQAVVSSFVVAFAALGALALACPRSVPDRLIGVAVISGTLAIPAGMLARGLGSVDRSDNAMLYLIPVVYGAYFFRRQWSAIVVLLASGSYGMVLTRLGAAGATGRWVTSSVALASVAGVVNALKYRDAERLGKVQDEAVSDALTGLANRRALEDEGPRRLADGKPSSLLLIDVDLFKQINDSLGHEIGDSVLARTAAVLAAAKGSDGMAVRLGGDEFVLLLPGCRPQSATAIADCVRRQVREATPGSGAEASVSIGVASSDGAAKLTELLRAADTALYRAKRSGRDTVRFAWVDSEVPAAPAPTPVKVR